MASDITVGPEPGSVSSRIKAFEAQSRVDNANSINNPKPSRLIIDSDGDHEEDWVSVPITAAAMTPTIMASTTTLAPPLPSRKQNHAPALSVSSFHSVSLSSESINSLVIDPIHDDHKEEDAISLESEPYEDVDSTTSLGSPGAVARLTADWNQLNQKKILISSLQRPQSAAPTVSGKFKPAPPPPPRSASASLSSSVSPSGPPSTSSSNGRRPPPPPPPNSNRSSTSTTTSSDQSSILSITSNASSSTSGSIHHGYPPYQAYKPKPPPSPNKPTAPLKPPSFKYVPSSPPSISLSHSSTPSSSSTSTTGPDPSTSTLALARPTPVPSLARKRYETVFDANLANLNIAISNVASTSTTTPKPALLSPSAALAIPRKGWRGLSIDLITSDEQEIGVSDKDTSRGGDRNTGENDMNKLDRLPGPVVRIIWTKSRLNKDRLGAIWLECDPYHIGSLDRETFVKGMWRIDAELRREELERTGKAKRTGSIRSVRSVRSLGSVKRQPSTASTVSTTSSSHSLRSVPSVGSLRRAPNSTPSTSSIPPVPLVPQPTPSPVPPSGKSGTLKTTTVPPPLPARKATTGTGLGMSKSSKVDLGDDEVDLLL